MFWCLRDAGVLVFIVGMIACDGEGAAGGGTTELEILISDVLGRVRTPPAVREKILDAFEASGLSGHAFARKWGLTYSTFMTWVQRRRREREVGASHAEGSVPQVMALVEAVVGDDASGDADLEVEAPGGILLRLRGQRDVALAVEFLRALKSC